MPVTTEYRPDGVAVITFQNGPVNALSTAIQTAISSSLRAALSRPDTQAAVILGDPSRGFFSSGADISEFRSFSTSTAAFDPAATWAFSAGDDAAKPVVAAVGGVCFGGGCELVLGCSARVATPRAAFALPELKLGIIPGLGGTQRLPRLVGFRDALAIMLRSTTVPADKAADLGLVDAVVPDAQLVDRAAALALAIALGDVPRRRTLEDDTKVADVAACEAEARHWIAKEVPKLSAAGKMPQFAACVDAALHGVRHGGRSGLRYEAQVFLKLVTAPTSRALVHLFFAARATAKVGDVDAVEAAALPRKVGVVGGGLMGAGIATACLAVGIPVVVREISEAAAAAAAGRVKRNLGPKHAPAAMPLLTVTTSFDDFRSVDIVIEAALEDVKVKQELFKTLASCTHSNCILATNTSTINIDLVAALIPDAHRAGRVIGAHFFSPAHKMPLLEIVRTQSTSPRVVGQLLALGKKMKKTCVVVGNCAGFAVHRMYFPQTQVSLLLIEKFGISPYRIDEACRNFGLPMGPFQLMDFVGLDIGVAVGQVFGMAYAERVYESHVLLKLLAAGRKGQKTGSGFYRYEKGSRQPIRDDAGLSGALPEEALRGVNDRKFSDHDIVEMTLLPCVNEATRLLQEKVAQRPGDVDVMSVYGMAFPSFQGGLMHWAKTACGGTTRVYDRLLHFHHLSGGQAIFKPSFALERAARIHAPLGLTPTPRRGPGADSDIVIVAAKRSAVGRAGRGGFKDTPAEDILAPVLEAVLKDSRLQPSDVDDIVIGTVLARGDSGVVQVRVGGVLAGYPATVPVKTTNRLCSSGLQAIADAANAVSMGNYDIVVAGGLESMSQNSFTNTSLKMNPRATSGSTAADCYLSMGETSENVAERFGISRERQDRMGVVSHARASNTLLAGRQRDEIVPIRTKVVMKDKDGSNAVEKEVVVDRDEGVRVGVTTARLAKLKPVFKKGGSTTAGNSSQISDGAAAVVMMKRSEAKIRGLKPLGALKSFAVSGVDPAVMGIGPVFAIPKALRKAGLNLEDIDLIELNEAFGSQSDYCIEKLGLNRDIVNVNGGAIAIGHPLGMTGARQTVSILHELRKQNGRYGLVSMCVGTGMGAAAVYEVCDDQNARL